LSQHPNTWCPVEKEPNYFSSDFPVLQGPKTYADYLQLFADAGPEHTALGEASVLYLFSDTAVAEIRRRYPDARLIIMIRNPVDMVYSFHSQMMITLNEDVSDFAKAWRLQDARLSGQKIPPSCLVPQFLQYRDIGRLSRFIRPIMDLCPAEQLKLIVFDDMKENPQQVFDEVTDYLQLPRYSDVNFRVVNANRKHASKALASLTDRGPSKFVRQASATMKRVLGLQGVSLRRYLAQLNTRTAPRERLSPELRSELVAYFSEEISELERITGRNLEHWRR
jgi:hypothetical protein